MLTATQLPTKRRLRKRGDGEGTLYLDEQRGLWIGELMIGYRPDGKPDRRRVTAKLQGDCRRKLDALKLKCENGLLPARQAEKETVAAFLARWLQAIRATVRPRTADVYADYSRLHIDPELGRHKLGGLRPEHIQTFYANKLAAGLAPATVHKMHAILHRALHDTVRWNLIVRNAADAVDAPTARKKELHPPTVNELRQLLAIAETTSDPFTALWSTAIYSGCRLGELLGLTWTDVDLNVGALTIRRNLVSCKATEPIFGEPKTARSRRRVTIPTPAVEALQAHRRGQLQRRLVLGPDYGPHDMVFASATGSPLIARNVQRAFKLALGRAGLPSTVRFHDLRHAAATLLLQAGVHPKVVSERLGHSTVTMTLDTYSHVIPSLDADAANQIARLLAPAAIAPASSPTTPH
ncbi:MAG: site-specific integrase [Chloroflexi bacterium]|nr:site-specific integrase [Chloroflexota bacterium]